MQKIAYNFYLFKTVIYVKDIFSKNLLENIKFISLKNHEFGIIKLT